MTRLPVLMYHNFCAQEEASKGLTLAASRFEQQLMYLRSKGYQSFFLSELSVQTTLPKRSVVLTFDDVTVSQWEFALPLLIKYGFKAIFFVPFAYLGKTDAWNASSGAAAHPIMTAEQLRALDPNVIELAHHSFAHPRLATLTSEALQQDFDQAQQVMTVEQLSIFPALAYPYGNFPRQQPVQSHFFTQLQENGIAFGFRIGNTVSRFPWSNPYVIPRIDIKGEDHLLRFRWKLRWGRLRLW